MHTPLESASASFVHLTKIVHSNTGSYTTIQLPSWKRNFSETPLTNVQCFSGTHTHTHTHLGTIASLVTLQRINLWACDEHFPSWFSWLIRSFCASAAATAAETSATDAANCHGDRDWCSRTHTAHTKHTSPMTSVHLRLPEFVWQRVFAVGTSAPIPFLEKGHRSDRETI